MRRLRISPVHLGATPCADKPDRWLLSNADKQEMAIACTNSVNEIFAVTVRLTKLLPEAQAYQLGAALLLNAEPENVDGGAIAYDVDNDSFLYCKGIDAQTLNLTSFCKKIDDCFVTARTLYDLLHHVQKDIGVKAIPAQTSSTMNLLINRKP